METVKMTKISLNAAQASLLIEHGNIIYYTKNESYYYLPHWYKKSGDLWEIISFEDLPKEVIQIIEDRRIKGKSI